MKNEFMTPVFSFMKQNGFISSISKTMKPSYRSCLFLFLPLNKGRCLVEYSLLI